VAVSVKPARLTKIASRFSRVVVGKVTCLEHGCDSVSIPLIPRVKVSDGGKSDGLGSLSAYRVRTFLI
jgi:hypothetical protein